MKIIERYITKEIFRFFSFIIFAVIIVFTAIEFVEKIDDIIEAGLSRADAIAYFQYRIPTIVAQILPVGMLLAIIIALGLMNKNNEIIALRCGGVSPYALVRPVIAFAFLMSLCLFLLNDIVVPITVSKSNRIWETGVDKKRTIESKQKNVWIKGDRAIYHIKYYNAIDQQISGITFYYFDKDFNLTKRLDAKEGRYQHNPSNMWTLTDVMEQTLATGDNQFRSQYHDQYSVALPYAPDELNRIVKKSEEMNFVELHNYINEVEAEGYDATNYKVDLHGKIAFPLVCIVLALAAASISLRRNVKENISIRVAAGIGVVFLYFIIHNFSLSLGYGEILPHYLAPWIANTLLLCVSGILLLNIN